MGEHSAIEWTDHTFNPWWGCEKVSPACAHCYAETFSRRVGFNDDPPDGDGECRPPRKPRLWGPGSERRMFGDKHWSEPLKWNRDAARDGVRRRVFCASMADVFEIRPELAVPRARLIGLIRATPHLDWLLLTKRPEHAQRLYSNAVLDHHADQPGALMSDAYEELRRGWLPNIWLGTTVEDQKRADERIPHLLAVPARVRFLSVEPLLGPVDLDKWMHAFRCDECGPRVRADEDGCCAGCGRDTQMRSAIDWVIVGGESGPGARPMRPQWARDVRDQCVAAGVPFLFKQWGDWSPDNFDGFDQLVGDGADAYVMVRVGKKIAGRELDGQTWDERPGVSA